MSVQILLLSFLALGLGMPPVGPGRGPVAHAESIGAPEAVAAPETGPEAARHAVGLALGFLEKDGSAWLEGRSHLNPGNGCVSCHVVTFAVWSHNEARAGGVAIDEERIDDLTRRAASFLAQPRKGRPVSWGQMLLARDPSPQGAAAERWREFRDLVIAMQRKEGYWEAKGQFPSQRRPRVESDAVATMWTTLALASFDEYSDVEVASVGDALAWIDASEPGSSTEWLAARLLIEHRVGEPDETKALREGLLERQNGDGGWGFLAGEPSDAMTTGQALYALARVGDPPASAAVERATAWLLGSQGPDGTWSVPSGRISQSADEEKDYVYKYWGTAWAAIGLSRSLVPVSRM